MVKLLEVILIEIVEKSTRADRMPRIRIVNVPFPVFPHLRCRHRAKRYNLTQPSSMQVTWTNSSAAFHVLVVGGGIYGLTSPRRRPARARWRSSIAPFRCGVVQSSPHDSRRLRYLQTPTCSARIVINGGHRDHRAARRRPIPFALPLYQSIAITLMRAGFILDLIVRRNAASSSHQLPGGRMVSRRPPALSRCTAGRDGRRGLVTT
jgi:hypothetical protein